MNKYNFKSTIWSMMMTIALLYVSQDVSICGYKLLKVYIFVHSVVNLRLFVKDCAQLKVVRFFFLFIFYVISSLISYKQNHIQSNSL